MNAHCAGCLERPTRSGEKNCPIVASSSAWGSFLPSGERKNPSSSSSLVHSPKYIRRVMEQEVPFSFLSEPADPCLRDQIVPVLKRNRFCKACKRCNQDGAEEDEQKMDHCGMRNLEGSRLSRALLGITS